MKQWFTKRTVKFIFVLLFLNFLIGIYLILPFIQGKIQVITMERRQDTWELKEEEPLIQTFFVTADPVVGVELWFTIGEPEKQKKCENKLLLELWDNRTMERYLNQVISIDELKTDQWNLFFLEHALTGGYGQEFYFRLTLLEESGDGRTLKVALADKEYPDNHFLHQGTEQTADIAFKLRSTITSQEKGKLAGIILIGNILVILSYFIQVKQQNKQIKYTNSQYPVSFLDLLRGSSAFMVFLVHYSNVLPWSGRLHQMAGIGGHGVEIFLLLSGYLLLPSIHTKSAGKYYLNRWFRIIPLYYAVLVIQYFDFYRRSIPLPADSSRLGWLRYFLCLQTSIPTDENFWVNLCATWTIPCFILFYLLGPVFKKLIFNYKSSLKYLAITFLIGEYLIPEGFKLLHNQLGTNFSQISEMFPVRYLWYFCVGISCYYARLEEKQKNFISILMGILIIRLTGVFINSRMEWIIIGAVLLMLQGNRELKEGLFCTIVRILSKYSYALYLVHPLVFNILGIYRQKINNDQLYMAIIAVAVMIGTYCMHQLWEEPWGRLGKRLAGKRKIAEQKK